MAVPVARSDGADSRASESASQCGHGLVCHCLSESCSASSFKSESGLGSHGSVHRVIGTGPMRHRNRP